MDSKEMVPDKEFGKNVDLNIHVDCADSEHATQVYATAVRRLKEPGLWGKLYPDSKTEFSLIKSGSGSGTAATGDYLRINVPGPGPVEGNGYDYVQIVRLAESGSLTADLETYMQLRPCSDPNSGSDKIAHFFDDSSSSSFVISLDGKRVTANYFGRNETINNKNPNLVDKIRNTVMGAGALAGLSERQWNGLLHGLLSAAL